MLTLHKTEDKELTSNKVEDKKLPSMKDINLIPQDDEASEKKTTYLLICLVNI